MLHIVKSFFSYRLKKLRDIKKVQQTELANFLGVKRNTISNWESGRQEPSMKILAKIAKFFQVSIDYLYGEDEATQSHSFFSENFGLNAISNEPPESVLNIEPEPLNKAKEREKEKERKENELLKNLNNSLPKL